MALALTVPAFQYMPSIFLAVVTTMVELVWAAEGSCKDQNGFYKLVMPAICELNVQAMNIKKSVICLMVMLN